MILFAWPLHDERCSVGDDLADQNGQRSIWRKALAGPLRLEKVAAFAKIAVAACAVLWGLVSPVYAGPILAQTGYRLDLLVTGAGATDGMALSPSGDLYITDYGGGRILEVSSPSQAGLHSYTVYASGIAYPTGLAFNADGQLFVTSSGSSSSPVLEVFPNGRSSVFATGFSYPTSIAARGNNLFVSASGDGTIERIDSSGSVHGFLSGFSGPNGPYGLSFDGSGNLYFTVHQTGAIYRSDLSGNVQLLGDASQLGATFTTISPGGGLFVSDALAGTVDTVGRNGMLSTFASGFAGKSNPPAIGPTGLVFDGQGDLYIGDGPNVWRVSPLATVPEPPAIVLLGLGMALVWFGGFGGRRKCRHNSGSGGRDTALARLRVWGALHSAGRQEDAA